MRLVDKNSIRSVDSAAVKRYGIKGIQLMENAGRAVADSVERLLSSKGLKVRGARVSIVAGKGNNGGDGFVAARHLQNAGARVTVYLLAKARDLKGDALANAGAWLKMKGPCVSVLSRKDLKKHEPAFTHSSVIVDALLGTGLDSPVTGLYAEAIDFINGFKKAVVSVDVPSGIDATTGAVLGSAVEASVTVTMALPKIGLYLYPGRAHAGRIEVADIGAPAELFDDEKIRWNLMTEDIVRGILKPREGDTHKGTYGHALVLGGSPGKTGAPYMAATGAMRAGAGLTTIALPVSLNPVMEMKTTEVMTMGLPETSGKALGSTCYGKVIDALGDKSVLVMGPGLGTSTEAAELVEKLLRNVEVPVVLDADGLNAVAGKLQVLRAARVPIVLTPHPGEMARLLNTVTSDVQADRVSASERLARETGAIVVLKGASTVIADPGGKVFINPTGGPGLATAGTGDVLSGMIGGLISQGYGALDASVASVFIHGLAAEELKEVSVEAGLMATDLLPRIPRIIGSLTAG